MHKICIKQGENCSYELSDYIVEKFTSTCSATLPDRSRNIFDEFHMLASR